MRRSDVELRSTRLDAPPLVTVVTTALDLLGQLAAGQMDDAAVLAALRNAFDGISFHLISERESYDGSVHHGLIIRSPEAAAVSLSVAAPTGLPWSLRGVVRSNDQDLLEVNGTKMTVADALARLDLVGNETLLRPLIDACLVSAELERDPVEIAADGLQLTANGLRRAKGLYSRAQTQAWLQERGLSDDDFAELVVRQAEFEALRQRSCAHRVEGWLATNTTRLEDLVLAWTDLDVDDPDAELRRLANDPLTTVSDALRQGRRAGVSRRPADEVLTGDNRIKPVIGEALRITLDGPSLAVILDRIPLTDPQARQVALTRLFEERLEAERSQARVTWFWGAAQETAS